MSESIKILNYIAGKFENPQGNSWLDNVEPATGSIYSRVANSDSADVLKAISAAKTAYPAWAALPQEERAVFLRKLSNLILANVDRFAAAESRDQGKPVSLARNIDIPRAAKNFSFFADIGAAFGSESHSSSPTVLNYTLRQPLGVVACISPWNLPLYLLTWKIAPALVTGNTVVAKPSELTPYTAHLLAELVNEAGFPAGVLNFIHGEGPRIGPTLLTHADIKAVSFTGSTRTGEEIAKKSGPLFKKVSLEMGGKNATLVFADSNFDLAVKTAVRAAFTNQGEICLCGSRVLVEESIYEKFRDSFVAEARKLKVGDPQEASTDQGALVSQAHMEKVLGAIEKAKQEGGKIILGGERVKPSGRCANGYFVAPTVIEGLSANCATNQEEIFGPVVTLMPFKTEADAVAAANSTSYGLSASIFTQNLARAHRVAANLETGLIWVNTWMHRDLRVPFGGVKNSGVGREGGVDALRFFTEAKNVCIQGE